MLPVSMTQAHLTYQLLHLKTFFRVPFENLMHEFKQFEILKDLLV